MRCGICTQARASQPHDEWCPVRQRDEARAEVERLIFGMELAWNLIANADPFWERFAYEGDELVLDDDGNPVIAPKTDEQTEWIAAAKKWRDEHYLPALKRHTKSGDGEQDG